MLGLKFDRKGNTLVELAVVLVIIGILAAVAIPAVTSYFDKADVGRCNVNVQTLLARYETEKLYASDTDLSAVLGSAAGSALACPAGGEYSVSEDGLSIKCSVHDGGAIQVQPQDMPRPKPTAVKPDPEPDSPPVSSPTSTSTSATETEPYYLNMNKADLESSQEEVIIPLRA